VERPVQSRSPLLVVGFVEAARFLAGSFSLYSESNSFTAEKSASLVLRIVCSKLLFHKLPEWQRVKESQVQRCDARR
jgi:hypothetical protein